MIQIEITTTNLLFKHTTKEEISQLAGPKYYTCPM